MNGCTCDGSHPDKRIVLTGGPGAGKTAVLELVRRSLCPHVKILPESAGIIFGGGFPRGERSELRRAGQRAIYHVQRELEASAEGDGAAITICDRGTVDGEAYWPGPGTLWDAVGSSREAQHARYAAVIHLRTPGPGHGYNHQNPLRIESVAEALAIDERLAAAWADHPRRFVVPSRPAFLDKARAVLELLTGELPACCRGRVTAI